MPCDEPKTCGGPHEVMDFKSNLSMTLLGANLIGVVMIAAMVAWSLVKSQPDMEKRITDRLNPLVERVAVLEEWKKNMEVKYP